MVFLSSNTIADHGRRAFTDWRQLAQALERNPAALEALAQWTAAVIAGGACTLICGNGGSAAEAQHFATELVGRYKADRRPLPAIALSGDGALLTCIGNDYSADALFARQVVALGRPGDLLVAMSTSGRSRNVVAAVAAAKAGGLHTLALLGRDGGELAGKAEREWIVPSDSTARIQEAHLLFIHVVCDYVDAAILKETAVTDCRSCPAA